MAGGIIHFWVQWDIQILVLMSFTIQVILLLFAGIRRHEGSIFLRILLWLAYQMADYTAIYALGHMSISSRSRDQQIIAIWAPFLLLHLGGPDTITAYSFEDNQLWLRHLLTLVGQVTGAAYVLHQYIAIHTNPDMRLAIAAILMFVSGCLKYGERTWALKCASIDSIASSLDKHSHGGRGGLRRSPYHGRRVRRLDKEEVLLGAHYVLNVCRSLFVDSPRMDMWEYSAIFQGIRLNGYMYMYELVEMELSLMYDMLYTKAAVIHSSYGCCIRIISLLSVVSSFLLFLYSSKDSYNRVDIMTTYVLLVGALVFELATSLKAAGSSWACGSLHARGCHRLLGALIQFRRFLQASRRRICLDSVGQYNVLDFCTRDVNDLKAKIAKTVGLEEWWNKLHFSSTTVLSNDMMDMIVKEIIKRDEEDRKNARGRWVLEKNGMYRDLMWSVTSTELDHSILAWHIASDLYLSSCREEEGDGKIRDAIRLLSNHLIFLLVVHPYLLPGVVRQSRFKKNCEYFSELWQKILQENNRMSTSEKMNLMSASKKMKDQIIAEEDEKAFLDKKDEKKIKKKAAYVAGTRLARMLLCNKWNMPISDMLQVIFGVWVEILCYAGHHCGEKSHAMKLSSGGEVMTIIWLLVGHMSMYHNLEGYGTLALRY